MTKTKVFNIIKLTKKARCESQNNFFLEMSKTKIVNLDNFYKFVLDNIFI